MLEVLRWLAAAGVVLFVGLFLVRLLGVFLVPEFWRQQLEETGLGRAELEREAREWVRASTEIWLQSIRSKFRSVAVPDPASPSGLRWKYQMRVGFAWNTLGESWNQHFYEESVRRPFEKMLADAISMAIESVSASDGLETKAEGPSEKAE